MNFVIWGLSLCRRLQQVFLEEEFPEHQRENLGEWLPKLRMQKDCGNLESNCHTKSVCFSKIWFFSLKYKPEPFTKPQLRAMNPAEVRYYKEEIARLLKKWESSRDDTRRGSNRDCLGRFQYGSSQRSAFDWMIPTETVSNEAPHRTDIVLAADGMLCWTKYMCRLTHL